VEDSDDAERALHAALMAEPRRPVAKSELLAMGDADARHNYETVLKFRDRLLAAGTLESCYRSFFRGPVDTPPLFLAQMAHVILRNILDGATDPLRLRAAELFFREQKATIQDGHALLADLETVDMHASGNRYGSLGRLIVEASGSVASADLDVLERANAELYWARESRYDTVISVTYGRPALDALAQVIALWVKHFVGEEVRVKPVRRIDEPHWAWHIGLDAESTAILNDLWAGSEVEQGRMQRILALFALEFAEPRAMRVEIAGRTVYLALSASEDGVVRMKPQNLLINLPLHEA
jgi:uncharacterized protein DUF6352